MVDRIIEVEKIHEVEKVVNVPIIQETIKEVEVIKNIYNEVDRVVERVVERVVPIENVVEKV